MKTKLMIAATLLPLSTAFALAVAVPANAEVDYVCYAKKCKVMKNDVPAPPADFTNPGSGPRH